jgi:hypothetical protein
MKRDVSVVRAELLCNILISGKVIKELRGLVGSETPDINMKLPGWKVKFITSLPFTSEVRYGIFFV